MIITASLVQREVALRSNDGGIVKSTSQLKQSLTRFAGAPFTQGSQRFYSNIRCGLLPPNFLEAAGGKPPPYKMKATIVRKEKSANCRLFLYFHFLFDFFQFCSIRFLVLFLELFNSCSAQPNIFRLFQSKAQNSKKQGLIHSDAEDVILAR